MSFDMAAQLKRQLQSVMPNAPRTIETVTEEITELKRKAADSFLGIGQRLNEAKELLPHGEWLPWLEGRVQFSERTAQKFMQLAREYEENPKLASDLGSEKAFALLALPREEREQIAEKGAVVDGKTKPAADLTKRDIQKIVQERKAEREPERPQEFYGKAEAEEYLRGRAQEDGEYREILRGMRDQLGKHLEFAQTRQDGIGVLKQVFSNRGGMAGKDAFYTGRGVGLDLHRLRGPNIKRSWTEVWDHLAVLALQEAARKKTQPEGQMVISGWMPGGTNPGHSCLCACMMDLGGGKLLPKVLAWDALSGRWLFKPGGAAAELEPAAWMALPEYKGGSL